jgi:transcriptional regulator with XRE-family HTH domain
MREKILSNLVTFREKANLSQDQMADKMHVSQSKYARFENGTTKTDLEMMIRFCQVLDITLVDVITWPDTYVNLDKIPTQKEETVLLSIEIKKDKKDQILRLVFGDNNLEIFNK